MSTSAMDPITTAVARVRSSTSFSTGPVRLGHVLEEQDLLHVELPGLSRLAVFNYLEREGFPLPNLGEDERLDGFLYVISGIGVVFVNSDDRNPVSRRRFTAAHELGHFLLHRDRMTGGRWIGDTQETIREADDPETADMEREANKFAAELLMPDTVCRDRASEFRHQYPATPSSVLVHRLASDLLVSREAMRYRLTRLGIINDRND